MSVQEERVELGVDGDSAYALLGPDLQEGESEWVTINSVAPRGSTEWRHEAIAAAIKAYYKLWERMPDRKLTYKFAAEIQLRLDA